RASLNLGYRINSRNAFRAFGSWSNINSFVSGEQRNVTAGMSVVTRLHKNISANFHLQNAYNIEDYYRNRNLMQLNVDYKFLKQHKFTLRSFYTLFRRQTENPEFTFSATYTYNFGFPVKRLMKAGDLSGRVTNDADEPVEGVIISMLNKSAVSDKNGEFSFKSIQPGNHLIIVDRSNFNINETINIPTPIEVSIFEDQVTPLHFKVTEGAKVTGRFTSSDQTSPNSPGKNIIIELADENEQFRISTSTDGTFSFPIVRPGNWRLKIYPNSIPSGFEINQTNFNLQLKPGENMELEIPLLRKKRNIIFKSQNISLSTSSAPKTDPVKPALDNKLKEPKNEGNKNDHIFYTVQVGVFSKKIDPGSTFFKGYKFDHEKKTDQYYIYFIGTFEHRDEAEKAKSELQKTFKGAFVVKFKNNMIVR
ncbi:MAG TPA: carboxypeptidase regulatory-like domain-containing protein, partial [Prolixibacteraceae bacterium]|nr:carboxypeptidase regulatory-like domain-containing protein [Prolixibacteraceae bacterium]